MQKNQNILHHIWGWQNALAEIQRALKQNGFYIFNDIAVSRFAAKFFQGRLKNYGIYTADDIAHFLKRNSFEIAYEEKPTGIIMKHTSMLFHKN